MSYTYDAAGNVTNDGSHTYTYDAGNRLVSVDGGATAQYGYDYQNQRVKTLSGGATTHYVWDGGHVIAEHDGAATGQWTRKVEYIYVRGSLIATQHYTVGQQQSTATRYYLRDKLSTRLVLDSSGNVIGRQAHLPFGEEFAESGTQEKHHFTTYESTGETGTDYAMNRQYSQAVARFQSADPYEPSGDSGKLVARFTLLPIKRITDNPDEPGFDSVFNGSTSKWPKVRARRGRDSALSNGPWIFIYREFFTPRNIHARMSLLASQAVVLIHEALHLQGFGEDDFGVAIDTFVIRSCINSKWSRDDMAI